MSADKKVPDIRFKGFSGEWIGNSVGQLCDFIVPGRTKPKIFDGIIPWITTPDITSNCVSMSKIGLSISKNEAKRIGAKIVPKNSIIISCVGDLGIVAKVDNELIINQQLHAFIPKENINKWFLLYELLTRKKYMENVATKTSVPYMNKDNCNSIPIVFPLIEEQTTIGNYFQKLDSLINQHQQKHDTLNNIKKAMLEKMFPKPGETVPEVRFKGFSREWREIKLGDVVEITMGQSPSSINYTNNPNDFVLVQGNADLKNGFVVPRVWTSEVTKTATQGALIFSVRAPVGKVGKTNYNVVLGRGVAAIYGNEFIYQQIKKLKSDNYWSKVSAGSTFDAISSLELASTLIWLPSESEQTAIGNYFQKLDTLIEQHQQQITKLNNIKQACLSKMFI